MKLAKAIAGKMKAAQELNRQVEMMNSFIGKQIGDIVKINVELPVYKSPNLKTFVVGKIMTWNSESLRLEVCVFHKFHNWSQTRRDQDKPVACESFKYETIKYWEPYNPSELPTYLDADYISPAFREMITQ